MRKSFVPGRQAALAIGLLLVLGLVSAAAAQSVVSQIEISGQTRRVAESLIRSTLGITPGVELSHENVQEAISALQALNVFDDIQLWSEPATDGGVKLIVVVKEYPALEGLRFKGQKEIKEKEMKEAVGLIRGQVVGPKDIARGRQRIVDLYREKGYLRAEVTGQLFDAEEEGTVYLQYDIDEGDKVKVARIRFLGNEALSHRRLSKAMETKVKRWWRKGDFQRDRYREDLDRVLEAYRGEGYQQAAIARDSVYYDSTRQRLFIDIEVDEGRQYRLGGVSWSGNELLSSEQLGRELELKEGDVFKVSTADLTSLAKSAYYERGYLDTEVIPQEQMRGDTVDVAFQVFEGDPFRVRHIEFNGNIRTREKVLRRELPIRPGQVFRKSQLEESQRRLYMLGFFKDVQVRTGEAMLDSGRAIDLTFDLEEQRTGAASMGAGYSDRDKLVGTLGLQIPNFRGLGQQLDFSWEFGTRREQFLIGFSEPWLFDTPTSFSFRVYTLNQSYYDSFDFKRNSASVRLGRRLRRPANTSVSVGYQLRDERYSNFADTYAELAASGSYQPHTTSSVDVVLRRDTRDLPDFPTRGTVLSYTPEVASSFIAGDVDYHRHELLFNYYRPSIWKFVLAVETKTAIIDGFSDWDDRNLSFWDRFTPGGVDWWDGQVRGYPDASLGPRDAYGNNSGGRSMLVINLEYRFPITERQVVGLVFADAGNAWAGIGDMNPTDLRR
ncbi:MAG: outer membrane protein assembly factor BamA, partial [Gemmatimonadota bacterium]